MRRNRCCSRITGCLPCILILGAAAYAGDVGVAHYEAQLHLSPERNGVETRVCCLLRNDGPQTMGQLSFDLLAKEQRCRARVAITGIWQKVDGEWTPLTFQHGTDGQNASDRKMTSVALASKLAPGSTGEIAFEYSWEATDPLNARDNYRPFATLPNGEKELCLLSDLAWLPRVRSAEELRKAAQARQFAKEIKPSWAIRVSAPKNYTVVALGGRHIRTQEQNSNIVSEWRSAVPTYPQLMAGRFHKQTVSTGAVPVVFYLPADYDHTLVPGIGQALAQAYAFFCEMFGPLPGEEIHVGVSSAGQGGHSGYLSFTMDTNMFGRQITEERLPMLMEIMRHELAHSWWGWSVSSYGSGTKFLRESLANFANACFVEKTEGQDRFTAETAKLFWMGMHTDVLCSPQGDSERAAYLKGPVVLGVLRAEMGNEKLSAVLRSFASKYQGSHATLSDFIGTCNTVTGRDWTEFFNQWCCSGAVPDYRIERLTSRRQNDAWTTEVTIKNAGDATITCPIELRTNNGPVRKSFRVGAGRTDTVAFVTPEEVTEAVIDPDHRTYQGSGRECRLKMLGVGNIEMEWIWYWRGVVLAEEGRYEEAIADISRAMASHGHPAFSYSRAVACLKNDDNASARSDFIDFLDAVVNSNNPCRSLVYPGLLPPAQDRQWTALNGILQSLTGRQLATHEQWRTWWQANRATFQPAVTARQLAPGGSPKD